ncbi:MAG: hypothetical protein E5Y55_25760 [Mesorhizobium sp.]|uniref:hypothetical protein n=1 Tax=Mesorhizobium sp. TaxID=1871066 RepID=UPI0011F7511B|nr:hypothetical protein [Mesorhizobium sp.]TIM40993.1 MAG: hypothetical protein E5Y55_25760 [Mesorhizobium sp.]
MAFSPHQSAYILQRASIVLLGRLPFGPGLAIQSGRCGLFGDAFIALNGLRFAESHGLEAEIDWGRRSLYFDAAVGPNVWTYYFRKSRFSFASRRMRSFWPLPFRAGAEDFHPYDGLSTRASVHSAIKRFCIPRPEIAAAVDAFSSTQFLAGRTLGVHIRLTDAAAGREDRRVPSLDHFVESTRECLESTEAERIFLASDDQRAIDRYRMEFGNRVVSSPALRSVDGISLHGHYDGGVSGSPFGKGRDVVIDALLLARCNHLIRSHSRVTCFSLCENATLTFTDLDLKYFGNTRTPWLHHS